MFLSFVQGSLSNVCTQTSSLNIQILFARPVYCRDVYSMGDDCTLLRVTLSALIHRYVLLFNLYCTIYERERYILAVCELCVTCRPTHGRWPYVNG